MGSTSVEDKLELLLQFCGNMKLVILVILMGFTASAREVKHRDKRSIGNLWDTFVEVTKLEEVLLRMRTLLAEGNADMVDLDTFLRGDKFRSIVSCLRESPDYVDLHHFLEENGVNLISIFQWANDELGWGEYLRPTKSPSSEYNLQSHDHGARSMKSLWDELISIIPYSDYMAWFLEMYAINPDMKILIERLQLQSTEHIRDHLNTCESYLDYRCWFISEGIDLPSVEQKGCSFLGWSDCSSPQCNPQL